MQLKKNQIVVFENGHTEGYLEARWSERHQAFYTWVEVDGEQIKMFSTTVEDKPARQRPAFVPNAKNCTAEIAPIGETAKAYVIHDGSNGCISRGNMRSYVKYVAKSICYVDADGHIYAPIWA